MKRNLKNVALLFTAAALCFTACKPLDEEEMKPTTTTVQRADDNAGRTEFDKAQDDIETVLKSDQYAGNQRGEAVVLPCGSVTVNTNPNNFTITYGSNCGSKVLSGSISVELISGSKFSDAGAKLKVTFDHYKVYYNASGESIVYDGVTYITNETGGRLLEVFTSTSSLSIVHKTRGTLKLSYDTLAANTNTPVNRVWNLFRKKTFATTGASNYTGISLTFEGDTTVADTTVNSNLTGDFTNVSEYGTDVKGQKFVHTVPTPFKWSYCSTGTPGVNNYRLKQGKVVHTADATNSFLGSNYVFIFSATAGYKLSGSTPEVDGGCGSTGYFIEGLAKQIASGQEIGKFSYYQSY